MMGCPLAAACLATKAMPKAVAATRTIGLSLGCFLVNDNGNGSNVNKDNELSLGCFLLNVGGNGGSNTDNELSLGCCLLGNDNDGSNEEDGLSRSCFLLDDNGDGGGGTDNELSMGYCLPTDNGGSGAEDCLFLFLSLSFLLVGWWRQRCGRWVVPWLLLA